MVSTVLVEKVKTLRLQGKAQEDIAAEVGLSQGTVSRILRDNGLGGKLMNRKRTRR